MSALSRGGGSTGGRVEEEEEGEKKEGILCVIVASKPVCCRRRPRHTPGEENQGRFKEAHAHLPVRAGSKLPQRSVC